MKDKSAILQMYHQERGCYDSVPVSKQYLCLLDDVVREEQAMRKLLLQAPELLAQFDKTIAAIDKAELESLDSHYVEGFQFGFLMALDVMNPNGQ